jgi:hypothetical protein
MKLKKFLDIIKENNDIDEPFENDDDFGDIPNIDDIDEIGQEDILETLLSTLRKMIKNSNIENYYVFTDDEGCINIQFVLNKTEKFPNIMKIMNLLKKFESDILIQYDSEFDLWESKEGDPLLTAKFYYDEDVSNPTFDEDVPF